MLKKLGDVDFEGKMRQMKGDSDRTAADSVQTPVCCDGKRLLRRGHPTQEHKSR